MLQAEQPDTFVFATGRNESVRNFVNMAFQAAGIELAWYGSGESEHAMCRNTKRDVMRVSPKFYRPAEVESLVGDFSKAERMLDWRPATSLSDLCTMMVDADIGRKNAPAAQMSRSAERQLI